MRRLSETDKAIIQMTAEHMTLKWRMTFREAYRKMIFKYYIIGYEERNDIKIPLLPPDDVLPTYHQFRYRAKKILDGK
jgi:hypothetical protein